ncbi:MAG: CHASE2 domain-containing protein [Planctomycetes bacterium]|nr:CHASE2 domain-containing protein [Planctomycetota bacterium]
MAKKRFFEEVQADFANPRTRRYRFFSLGLGAFILGLILLFHEMPWTRPVNDNIEYKLYDLRTQFRPRIAEARDQIVMIDIDDKSLKMIGRWPWPRQVQGQLVRALKDMGARMVMFDVEFFQPQAPVFDSARLGERRLKEELRGRFGSVAEVFKQLRGDVGSVQKYTDELPNLLRDFLRQELPPEDPRAQDLVLFKKIYDGTMEESLSRSEIELTQTERDVIAKFALAQLDHDRLFAEGVDYSQNVVLPFHFDASLSFVDQAYEEAAAGATEGDESARIGQIARDALQLLHAFVSHRIDMPNDEATTKILEWLRKKYTDSYVLKLTNGTSKTVDEYIAEQTKGGEGKIQSQSLAEYVAVIVDHYRASFEKDLLREILADYVSQRVAREKRPDPRETLDAITTDDLWDAPDAPFPYVRPSAPAPAADGAGGENAPAEKGEVDPKFQKDVDDILNHAKGHFLLRAKWSLPRGAIKGEAPEFKYNKRVDPAIYRLLRDAEDTSFVSIDPDSDGILRRSHLVWYDGEQPELHQKVMAQRRERLTSVGLPVPEWFARLEKDEPVPYLQIAFKAALMLLGVKNEQISIVPNEYVEVRDVVFPAPKAQDGTPQPPPAPVTVRVPIDGEGRMIINWAGVTEQEFDQTFMPHLPFGKVIEYVRAEDEIRDLLLRLYRDPQLPTGMQNYVAVVEQFALKNLAALWQSDKFAINRPMLAQRLEALKQARLQGRFEQAAAEAGAMRAHLGESVSPAFLKRAGVDDALNTMTAPPKPDTAGGDDPVVRATLALDRFIAEAGAVFASRFRYTEQEAGDLATFGALLRGEAEDPHRAVIDEALKGVYAVLSGYFSENLLAQAVRPYGDELLATASGAQDLAHHREEMVKQRQQAQERAAAPRMEGVAQEFHDSMVRDATQEVAVASAKIAAIASNEEAIRLKQQDRERTRVQLSQDVRGKICVVGATFTGGTDLKPTPLHPRYPGVGLHTNTINTFLTRQFLHPVKPWVNVTIIVAIALAMSLFVSFAPPLRSVAFFLLVLGAYIFVNWLFFVYGGLWIEMSSPLLACVFPYTAITAYRQLTEEQGKREMKSMFSTYLSPEIVDELAKDPTKARLGGEKRQMTVCFSDVAGFTTMSESLTPEALVELLNVYLTAMTDNIMSNRGTVDKYAGDGIMWFHGAPLNDELHAVNACKAGLENLEKLAELNEMWVKEGKNKLGVRIGINSGHMVAGNMGSTQKLNYTVMGDAVNQSARFEPANKDFGTKIMTAQSTVDLCGDHIHFRRLARLLPKGKKEYITVYEVRSMAAKAPPDMVAHSKRFEEGLDLFFKGDFPGALKVFEECVERWDDQPCQHYYLETCQEMMKTPPDAKTWDGVFHQVNK